MNDYLSRFVVSLLAYAAQRDISPERLCMLSGIDYTCLVGGKPTELYTRHLDMLWLNAVAASGDSLFGLHFGESLQLAALGVVGEIIKSSATVGDAVVQASALTPLIAEGVDIGVLHEERTFSVQLASRNSHNRDEAAVRQMMDFLLVFTLHELDGLVLKKIQPESVSVPYQPDEIHEYRRVLRCSSIQCGAYALECSREHWNTPVITADYEVQQRLLLIVAAQQGSSPLRSFQHKVRQMLIANSYLGLPVLEDVAANLHTSARSLQRKLRDEGASFQSITESVQESLALHYIEAGRPLKEIASVLGYNETSAFNRAFRRWTGTTPARYRKKLLNA